MTGVMLFASVLLGVVLVVRRPEWIAPYFAFLIFMRVSDVLRAEYGLPSSFMFIGPLLLGVPIWRWLTTGERLGRGWRPALLMGVIYTCMGLASFIYAFDPGRTHEALMEYADGLLIMLVMTASLRRLVDFDRTLWAILVAGAVLAGLAVIQQLAGGWDQTFAGFARTELRNIYDDSAGFRSEGPVSANYFGMILVAVVPLAMHRLVFDGHRHARRIAALALVLLLAAIFFTYSRGAVVALAVVISLMAVWVPRRRRVPTLLAAGATLALGAIVILPSPYGERLMALGQVAGIASGEMPQDRALRGRLSELRSAAMMFGDHPLLGVGYGNFELHYGRYAARIGLDGRREERQAHSLYLEVAAETGIVGLVVFAALVGVALKTALRARAESRQAGDAATARAIEALLLSLLGYLAGSLFLHLTYPRYFWLLLAITYATSALLRPAPSTEGHAQRARLIELPSEDPSCA